MWHLTRDRVLAGVAVLMTLAAGTLFVLYVTKDSGAAPKNAAPSRAASSPSKKTDPSAEPVKGRSMKAGYAVRSRWKDGFNAEVTVTNIGTQPVEGWTVQLKMPSTVDVTDSWGAKADQAGGALILRSQAWNTYLEPGGSIRMGFEAKGAAVEPTSCTINGSPC